MRKGELFELAYFKSAKGRLEVRPLGQLSFSGETLLDIFDGVINKDLNNSC